MNRLEHSMSTDHRAAAKAGVESLIALMRADANHGQLNDIVEECEALARAIGAFHMEGIRFRMFNVDRLLSRAGMPAPPRAAVIFADVRRELEAAGFHTRSHQAPTTQGS
jgi:hypothetical protein